MTKIKVLISNYTRVKIPEIVNIFLDEPEKNTYITESSY